MPKLKPAEIARRLQALRPKSTRSCAQCHVEFVGTKEALYCSNVCRAAAWYANPAHKQQALQAQRDRRSAQAKDKAAPHIDCATGAEAVQ